MNSLFRLFESLLNKHGRYKIGGKSFKYNQLVQNGNFESTSGWNKRTESDTFTVSNNEAIITLSGQQTVSFGGLRQLKSILAHKYFLHCEMKGDNEAVNNEIQGAIMIGSETDANIIKALTTDYQKLELLVNKTTTYTSVICGPYLSGTKTGKIYIKDVKLIDLTELFGAGNEPTTLEQFYATDLGKAIQGGWYPSYSPTNAIYEADLSEMSLSGKNLYPVGKANKYTYASDYQVYNANNSVFLKAGTYTLSFGTASAYSTIIQAFRTPNTAGRVADIRTVISYVSSSAALTWGNSAISLNANRTMDLTLSEDLYITLCGNGGVNDLAQIEIGNTATTYTPYVKPQTVSILQNGQPLKIGGIGTAKDYYLNASGKVNREFCFVSNIASERWYYVNNLFYIITLPYDKLTEGNALCSKYAQYEGSRLTMPDKHFTLQGGSSTTIWVRDDDFTDVNSFVSAISDMTLLYELATPTTEQANSVMLRKGFTKCYDKNNLELEIEVIDPLNFNSTTKFH